METRLHFAIQPQPDDTTCGPTCLQAIYAYYDDPVPLTRVIGEVQMLETGGTLASLLGCHALARGYAVTLYTFDLQVFDPTWFTLTTSGVKEKLNLQLEVKRSRRMEVVTQAYHNFLDLGGKVLLADLTLSLLRTYLKKEIPIITGLSSTFLYRSPREVDYGNRLVYDDINGEPTGHFVVLSGYDSATRSAMVSDPLHPNPMSLGQHYEIKLNRLVPAIMLATISFDANMLIITPQNNITQKRTSRLAMRHSKP